MSPLVRRRMVVPGSDALSRIVAVRRRSWETIRRRPATAATRSPRTIAGRAAAQRGGYPCSSEKEV
jgi:hypothetical protein